MVIKVSPCCHDNCDPNALFPGDALRLWMGETEVKIKSSKQRDMLKTDR
jgi:hypothetical protein